MTLIFSGIATKLISNLGTTVEKGRECKRSERSRVETRG